LGAASAEGPLPRQRYGFGMRNAALHVAGLVMGTANTIRHRYQGYVTPRPFPASDVERTIRHAVEVVDRLQQHGQIDWSDKRVLELGPGSDLATGAIIMARGAAAYQAVDLFDNRGQADPALYAELGRLLGAPVDISRLQFTLATFPMLSELDGAHDLIISNATLEHIPEIGALFRNLLRLSAPPAKMVHHIDGQTHMRGIKRIDPLNILRYSDRTYARLLDFPGAPNRLRAAHYLCEARTSGWERVQIVPDLRAHPRYLERTRFSTAFRGLETLEMLTFTLLAETPA
jgi:SAM-dependent methyltransferase